MMLKLYIDFDSTIVNACKRLTELYSDDYSSHPDFIQPKWFLIDKYDCSDQCSLLSQEELNDYFCQSRFFEWLEYMDWAHEVLLSLHNKGYDITIVTLGRDKNLMLKKFWCKNNLPFCNFIGLDFNEHHDKSSVNMSDGILLDDVNDNLVTSNAKYKFVFGDEAEWNRGSEFPRCYNWVEFEKEVERLEIMD